MQMHRFHPAVHFLLINFHTCGAINKMERNAMVPAISHDRIQKKRKRASYPIFTDTKVKLIIPAVIKPMINANFISSFVGFIQLLIFCPVYSQNLPPHRDDAAELPDGLLNYHSLN
jgi:hypothetical protein